MPQDKGLGLPPGEMASVFRAILEQSWNDPAFLQRLQDDPRTVLASLGWNLPPGQEMRFVMNTPELQHLVIPTPPAAWVSPMLRF